MGYIPINCSYKVNIREYPTPGKIPTLSNTESMKKVHNSGGASPA